MPSFKNYQEKLFLSIFLILVSILLAFLSISGYLTLSKIRFFFDDCDIAVYYKSSQWVSSSGILYKDIFSEYPLLANLIFAFIHFISDRLFGTFDGFCYVWILVTGALYSIASFQIAKLTNRLSLIAWLTPACLYFALFRYDIYPTIATLFALIAIKQKSYFKGALYVGIAIALKGYAIFALPALCVYVFYHRGLVTATKVAIIATTPMALSILIVYGLAGLDGVKSPFLFHLTREINSETIYFMIDSLLNLHLERKDLSIIPVTLQICTSLIAAALRPKTFFNLMNAMTLSILGFITFSVFHSPQFILWTIPFVCFAKSRELTILTVLLGWSSYAYFPVTHDIWFYKLLSSPMPMFITLIILLVLHIFMMISSTKNIYDKNLT